MRCTLFGSNKISMPIIPPLIGITVDTVSAVDRSHYRLGCTYTQAIKQAGGLPLMIPGDFPLGRIEELRRHLDGLLLTGGSDLDPKCYAGQPHPRLNATNPERDQLEISLVQLAASSGWPFLGICRGIQVINVALGGTLFTDLADQFNGSLKHDYYPTYPRDYLAHRVVLAENSRLRQILMAEEFPVNSLHHQGIRRLASSLNETAYAPDGLIEAVELPGHPFGIGVQWHPEELLNSPRMQALFSTFVQASAQRAIRFPHTIE